MKIIDGFVLIGIAWLIGCVIWLPREPDKPQPRNMPTQDEVRQIMLDCEQFNPGKRCIFVAMVVPDFSEAINEP